MAINLFYEERIELNERAYTEWVNRLVVSENKVVGEINYIFCNDTYLLEMNEKFLKHNTYTDIISFDYTDGNIISGDVFISVERVRENAQTFRVALGNELKRVMAHGILHLMGYGDKSEGERAIMRLKEEEKIKLFHVEH